jgi:hypothetical protein
MSRIDGPRNEDRSVGYLCVAGRDCELKGNDIFDKPWWIVLWICGVYLCILKYVSSSQITMYAAIVGSLIACAISIYLFRKQRRPVIINHTHGFNREVIQVTLSNPGKNRVKVRKLWLSKNIFGYPRIECKWSHPRAVQENNNLFEKEATYSFKTLSKLGDNIYWIFVGTSAGRCFAKCTKGD